MDWKWLGLNGTFGEINLATEFVSVSYCNFVIELRSKRLIFEATDLWTRKRQNDVRFLLVRFQLTEWNLLALE